MKPQRDTLAPRGNAAYFRQWMRGDVRAERGTGMTQFDDRARAFEAQFAHDQDLQFRIAARRNRLIGEWAAARMGLTPAETDAYAKSVVQADFEEVGDEDVIRKLTGDLTAAGVDVDHGEIRSMLETKMSEARRQFIDQV